MAGKTPRKNKPKTRLSLTVPWQKLTSQQKAHCTKLGIDKTIWEKNRGEGEPKGLNEFDMICVPSKVVPWRRVPVTIFLGERQQRLALRDVERW